MILIQNMNTLQIFEVLTAVRLKIKAILDMTLCSLVDNYQLLGGTCCLHIQGEKVLLASNFRT
jgi:hypothetical protein